MNFCHQTQPRRLASTHLPNLLIMLTATLLTACASVKPSQPSPWHGNSGAPPSDMQTVRVVARLNPDGLPYNRSGLTYRLPSTRGDAAASTAYSGLWAMVAHPAAVPFMPMTVAQGALFGWLVGVPHEKSKAASETLLDIWSGATNLNVNLSEDLCRLGALLMPVNWKVDSEASIQTGQQSALPHGVYMLVFTPIEVELALSPLTRNEDPNPTLVFVMKSTVKIVRLADSEEVASLQLKHLGRSHQFMAWAKDGGKRLTSAIAEGQQKIAEEIIDRLFPR